MRRFSIIISAVFHPLIMPWLCVMTAYQFDWFVRGLASPEQVRTVGIIVFLSTVAFPGINILLLRWYGALTSLEMPERKQRIAPFLSSVFFFSLGYFMLRKASIPEAIYSILLGSLVALVCIMLINFKWKISAHATGIFGLIGTALGLFVVHGFTNLPLLCAFLIIGGLVMTARLILKAHTPAQVYAGSFIGFLFPFTFIANGIFI